MKSTSFGSRDVRMPARSPGLSSTGPEVILNPTPSSLAMMLLKVVLPSPGGPCRSVWSSGSPRYLAASTNTLRFSTTFCCPLKSRKRSGRRAFSKSFSAEVSFSSCMSKSSGIFLIVLQGRHRTTKPCQSRGLSLRRAGVRAPVRQDRRTQTVSACGSDAAGAKTAPASCLPNISYFLQRYSIFPVQVLCFGKFI